MGEGYDYPEQNSAAATSNPAGIVGFILAFCISPVGLLISAFALLKAPRGFAIAGVFVGLIGTIIWAVVGFAAWFGGPALVEIGTAVSRIETTRQAIERYESDNGALPADLAVLGLTAETTTDPWGTPFRYELSEDGSSWTLTIAGPDGTFDDGKDVRITPDMPPNRIGESLGETFGEDIVRRRMDRSSNP